MRNASSSNIFAVLEGVAEAPKAPAAEAPKPAREESATLAFDRDPSAAKLPSAESGAETIMEKYVRELSAALEDVNARHGVVAARIADLEAQAEKESAARQRLADELFGLDKAREAAERRLAEVEKILADSRGAALESFPLAA